MRQAISTKYLCPTNYKGARISAKADAGRIIDDWDHGSNADGNHCRAAKLFAAKFNWPGLWIGGSASNSAPGYVFVWAGDERPRPAESRATIGIEGRDWFYLPPANTRD